MNFERLFHPRGIAIIGASSDLTRIGGQPIKALKEAGYRGSIYPVNPKYGEIAGLPCVNAIADIEGLCDLAVIAVRADLVLDAIRACGKKGIAFAVVLSGGFRESGAEGAELESQLAVVAREAGVRVVGPNCQGLIAVHGGVFAVFGSPSGETQIRPGSVSMCFQSGGVGFAILTLCDVQGIAFRHCISTGNEADIKTTDLLDALIDDSGTSVIFSYFEGIPNGRALLDVAKKALRARKPILVWKGGRTDVGAQAAASHTAQLTGSYDVFRAACRQFGLIEVKDAEEVVDFVKAFGANRLPKGINVGAISISGGIGIVFADAAIESGLSLPKYQPETLAHLAEIIPSFGSAANPADVTASVFNDTKIFTEAIDCVLADPTIHQACLLLASVPDPIASDVAAAIIEAHKRTEKPIMVGLSVRRDRAEKAYAMFEQAGIPVYSTPARLARAAAVLSRYAQASELTFSPLVVVDDNAAAAIAALPAQPGALDEAISKQLILKYGVRTPSEVFIADGEDVEKAIEGLHFPLVAKIVSPDISHKTEAGGVKLNLCDAAAVIDAVKAVRSNALNYKPSAKINGVLVAEMIGDGLEVIVGVVNDSTFGPVVTMGMGGILTEILKDVTYRVAPFDEDEVAKMVSELRGSKLFDGVRGGDPLDKVALARAVSAMSKLAWDGRDRIAEIDVNPLFVRPAGRGVVAADALVIMK